MTPRARSDARRREGGLPVAAQSCAPGRHRPSGARPCHPHGIEPTPRAKAACHTTNPPQGCQPTLRPPRDEQNLAFATLSDDTLRREYVASLTTWRSDDGAFDGRPVSQNFPASEPNPAASGSVGRRFVRRFVRQVSVWAGPDDEATAIFVDEAKCIGCRNCAQARRGRTAPRTAGSAREPARWGRRPVRLCPCLSASVRRRPGSPRHLLHGRRLRPRPSLHAVGRLR